MLASAMVEYRTFTSAAEHASVNGSPSDSVRTGLGSISTLSRRAFASSSTAACTPAPARPARALRRPAARPAAPRPAPAGRRRGRRSAAAGTGPRARSPAAPAPAPRAPCRPCAHSGQHTCAQRGVASMPTGSSVRAARWQRACPAASCLHYPMFCGWVGCGRLHQVGVKGFQHDRQWTRASRGHRDVSTVLLSAQWLSRVRGGQAAAHRASACRAARISFSVWNVALCAAPSSPASPPARRSTASVPRLIRASASSSAT